jgi:hypothetical protein
MAEAIYGRPELVPGLTKHWDMKYLEDILSAKCAYHKHNGKVVKKTVKCPGDCSLRNNHSHGDQTRQSGENMLSKNKPQMMIVRTSKTVITLKKKPEMSPQPETCTSLRKTACMGSCSS